MRLAFGVVRPHAGKCDASILYYLPPSEQNITSVTIAVVYQQQFFLQKTWSILDLFLIFLGILRKHWKIKLVFLIML